MKRETDRRASAMGGSGGSGQAGSGASGQTGGASGSRRAGGLRARGKRASIAEFAVAALILLLAETLLLVNFAIAPQKAKAEAAIGQRDSYLALQAELEGNRQNAAQRQAYLAELEGRLSDMEKTLPPALHNEDISLKLFEYAQARNIALDSLAFSPRELASPSEYAGIASPPPQDGLSSAEGAAATGIGAGSGTGSGAGSAAGSDSGSGSGSRAGFGSAVGAIGSAAAEAELIANGLGGLSRSAQPAAAELRKTMSVQAVQLNFVAEAHMIGEFLRDIENGEKNARIKSVSASREQEGVIKGSANLEYVSLSRDAESGASNLHGLPAHSPKDSLFQKYEGYVEEGVDPTILLVASDDDVSPNFYMILNASSSNDTKVTYGVFPRTETELYFNANNASRAKLVVSGDENQLEYTYSLGSNKRTEKRRLDIVEGKIRLDVISRPRADENDKVSVLLDVENGSGLPLEIRVRNDDVLEPRFHLGEASGDVAVRP